MMRSRLELSTREQPLSTSRSANTLAMRVRIPGAASALGTDCPFLVGHEIAGREEVMHGCPQARRHQAEQRKPQRLRIGTGARSEPVTQHADRLRCDDEITEV